MQPYDSGFDFWVGNLGYRCGSRWWLREVGVFGGESADSGGFAFGAACGTRGRGVAGGAIVGEGCLIARGFSALGGRAAALHSDILGAKGFYRVGLCVWDVAHRSRLL
jgi:hypothetical protein